MNNKLLALKLVLEALGVGTNINTVEDRKEKQKAIYLAKVFGIDLGYSYGWYVRGPYSPSLTNDYYELQSPTEVLEGILREDIAARTQQINETVINSPLKPNDLPQPDWLELLASWHYLTKISKYSVDRATAELQAKKPHVSNHVNIAQQIIN